MIATNNCSNCKHNQICSIKKNYEQYFEDINKIPASVYIITEIKCTEFLPETPQIKGRII